MSTSNAHQQSLAEAGSETRPSMLKRAPRMQKEKDLRGDDLKHYEAEIEAMNLILISIPNTSITLWMLALLQKLREALVSVYNRFAQLMNDLERNPIIFPKVTINTKFLNCLQPEWLKNTRRSYVQDEVIESNNVQNDAGNIQRTLRTASLGTVANVQCYNFSEKGHYARNFPKPRIKNSKYFMEQMLLAKQDEAGVLLTDEQNDFLFADVSRMEEIKELSANICLMVIIQLANIDGSGNDSAFLSEVIQIVLWIVDSGCFKDMTGDRSLLQNFVEKFIGTVRFGNDHFAAITGYGDY
nr:integrase, catalytic region, zinc finger, CCHC-type, peptidase aspartic, catalytic [Tanacetum cinerariifolium]